jgi:hypothetical protein
MAVVDGEASAPADLHPLPTCRAGSERGAVVVGKKADVSMDQIGLDQIASEFAAPVIARARKSS